ncbi:hypothetical protein EYF80_061669 [Liparis tanakae]|uniref:Uncharacterized protein n=1 Tax=Liparis tanakae TaxID=230148 RepID=A0A4Z2EI86_9TELE|nr:hypothetical protein EYF80_061669 [Liparis tanakae]
MNEALGGRWESIHQHKHPELRPPEALCGGGAPPPRRSVGEELRPRGALWGRSSALQQRCLMG